MQTFCKISGAEFDAMVDRGAFDVFKTKKIELIDGQLRVMNPVGPIHDDHIRHLLEWSFRNTTPQQFTIQCQSGIACDDDRPEPDLAWLRPARYGRNRPRGTDVQLLIEIADSSIDDDLKLKSRLYAERGIQEYWVVDVPGQRIHVMNDSDGRVYQSVQIAVPPEHLSPRCHPNAWLPLRDLFEFE